MLPLPPPLPPLLLLLLVVVVVVVVVVDAIVVFDLQPDQHPLLLFECTAPSPGLSHHSADANLKDGPAGKDIPICHGPEDSAFLAHALPAENQQTGVLMFSLQMKHFLLQPRSIGILFCPVGS